MPDVTMHGASGERGGEPGVGQSSRKESAEEERCAMGI